MSCSLFAILARSSRTAVVFRRGPAKRVLLLSWDLDTDTLTEGQWLKGRVYEHNSDLSPDGSFLVYCAGQRGERWTAVSRPPYLTALALWQYAETFLEGGLFDSDDRLLLNGAPFVTSVPAPTDGRTRWTMGLLSGDPYWSRLLRDGWHFEGAEGNGPRYVRSDPPHIIWRANPIDASTCVRVVHTSPYWASPRRGPIHHFLVRSGMATPLEGVDWADWDRNGDLLFSRAGELRRLPASDVVKGPTEAAQLIADLEHAQFEPKAPPPDYDP